MSVAALVTWAITAAVGFFMLLRWARRGGLRRVPGAGTHFQPARVFTHFGLAAAGLVVWIAYLVTGRSALAWVAVADLVLVALLGGLLVHRWATDGRIAMAGGQPAAVDLAEQHIPRSPVVMHGIFAVTTVVLVVLTALGVGRG